jgi:hypothetical protein
VFRPSPAFRITADPVVATAVLDPASLTLLGLGLASVRPFPSETAHAVTFLDLAPQASSLVPGFRVRIEHAGCASDSSHRFKRS